MTFRIQQIRNEPALPGAVRDSSAWYGSEMVRCNDWMEHLSQEEILQLESLSHKLESQADEEKGVELTSIISKDVPLSALAPRLRAILEEVLNGRGFVLIRGLPIQSWSRRRAAMAFLAIGVHLGNLRMQNAQGHLLGHVRDLGRSSEDPNTRIYQTRERQTHHTDSCDVVALMCLQACARTAVG